MGGPHSAAQGAVEMGSFVIPSLGLSEHGRATVVRGGPGDLGAPRRESSFLTCLLCSPS